MKGGARGTVVQVSVSDGGLPKRAVAEAFVSRDGVAGDRQRDTRYHGGPDRAVCLFALERLEALGAEGHAVGPGVTGENLTVSGLDWERVTPGAVLRTGEAVLEVTRYTPPCRNQVEFFVGGGFLRISHKVHPGWSRVYARVLAEGVVRPGDEIEIVREGGAAGGR